MSDIAWALGWGVIIGGAWATVLTLFVAGWSVFQDRLKDKETLLELDRELS